ncbi:hypothetical protein HDV00_009006 [Rhizophlyctis rosea]|nr:hypothetical protein HDV00_009006 [Rhizophlyctis rosea]
MLIDLDGINLLNLLSGGALTWAGLHTLVYTVYNGIGKRGMAAWVWGVKAVVALTFALQATTSAAIYYQYLGPHCFAVGKVNTISFHISMIGIGIVLATRLGSMIGWDRWITRIFLSIMILQRVGAAVYDVYATENYDDTENQYCGYVPSNLSATLSLCSDIFVDLCCTIGFTSVCTRYLIKAGSVSDLYAVLIESNVLRSTSILCANVVQLALMYTVGTASPWMTTVWNVSDLLYMYVVCYDSDMIKLLRGGNGSSRAVSGPSGQSGRPSTSKDRDIGGDSSASHYNGSSTSVKVTFEDQKDMYGGGHTGTGYRTRAGDNHILYNPSSRDDYRYDMKSPSSPVNGGYKTPTSPIVKPFRDQWAPSPPTPTYAKLDPYPPTPAGAASRAVPYGNDSESTLPSISGSLEEQSKWMGNTRETYRDQARRDPDYNIPMTVMATQPYDGNRPYNGHGYSQQGYSQEQGYGHGGRSETPGGYSNYGGSAVGRSQAEDIHVKEYAGSVKSFKSAKSSRSAPGNGGYGGGYENAPPLPDERIAPAVTGYPTYRQTQTPEYAKEW